MRVALTGTPGTGKTSAAAELDVPVVALGEVIEREGFWTERDEARDSLVADLDALEEWLAHDGAVPEGDHVVESHLAHLLPADRVVVLRCRPEVLRDRLAERGVSGTKARENAESEALDVVLSEAVEAVGRENVYEVDTTDRTPAEVAAAVEAVFAGEREPSAGRVSFTDYL
ncbi:MAG: adenylate kinase family protein [Haloferacaceae archaeon]